MSDIFISYAREDLDRVALLAQALAKQGWGVFWDRTIPTGKAWRDFIGAKLDAARCVVVVWSQHSVKSGFVHEEADVGKERGILAPVLIDRVRLPLGFGGIQAADLSQWDGTSTASILEQLFADIGQLPGLERKRETERRDFERAAKEEARRVAAAEEARRADEETQLKAFVAVETARRKAEEEKTARLRAEQDAQRREAEERAAKEEAKRRAAEEQAKKAADEEARRREEAEASRRREEEPRRKAAEQESRPGAATAPAPERPATPSSWKPLAVVGAIVGIGLLVFFALRESPSRVLIGSPWSWRDACWPS